MDNLNRQSYTEAPLPSLQELESAIDASQLNADVITTYGNLPPTASSSSIEPVAEMTQTAPIESSTATSTSAPVAAAQSPTATAMPPPSASFPSSQVAPQSPQTSKPTSATQPHAPLPTPPRHLESNPLFRSIAASTSAYPHLHPQPLHDPPSDFSKPPSSSNGVPTSASQSLIHSNPHHSHLHHNGYSGQLARYGNGVGGAGTSSGMAGHVHPHMAPGVGGFYAGAHTPAVSRPSSPFSLNTPVDYDGLSWPSVGTRARLDETPEEKEARIQKLSGALKTVLECIGEDPTREGLLGTPERYAKAMLFFTKGYEENLRDIVNGAVFTEDHDELVIVKDIDVFSLCEHHLVPFTGKMHIGYIPNRRVIGLSKLARIAEMFSRRLQVQERLTKQVALAVSEILSPQGVAVVMESTHMCMVMRGVQKSGAITTTSCMLGRMRQSAKTREEFLNLLKR